MTMPFLYCYTLRRQTTTQSRLEAVLPCAIEEAVEILALYLDNKALAFPFDSTFPRRIWESSFFAVRLTTQQIATGLFTPDFLTFSSNPLLRQLEWWLYRWRLIRPRLKMETAVPEIVFEIFYSAQKVPVVDPTAADEGLILARLHLWGRPGSATYLRVFLGWQEAASLAQCQTLIALLEDYVTRVEQLHGTVRTVKPPAAEESKTAENPDPPISSSPEESPPHTTMRMTSLHADAAECATHEPVRNDSAPPRFYPKSLYKICKVAIKRQQWIEQGVIIQDIEWTRHKCKGPSKNTLLKVTDLVLYWDERSYRWDVVRWLHQATGHTPAEITDLVNDLRGKLKPEEWALITHSSKSH